MSNQLFTAKGKYHLFFTLLRRRFIYLRRSHRASSLWKPRPWLPRPTWAAPPPASPVPRSGFALHIVGRTDPSSEEQTNWLMKDEGLKDRSGSQGSGCWRFRRRCSFSLQSSPQGGCHIHRGRCLVGSAFSSGPTSRHSARGSHGTYPVGREKSGASDGRGVCRDGHPEGQWQEKCP